MLPSPLRSTSGGPPPLSAPTTVPRLKRPETWTGRSSWIPPSPVWASRFAWSSRGRLKSRPPPERSQSSPLRSVTRIAPGVKPGRSLEGADRHAAVAGIHLEVGAARRRDLDADAVDREEGDRPDRLAHAQLDPRAALARLDRHAAGTDPPSRCDDAERDPGVVPGLDLDAGVVGAD